MKIMDYIIILSTISCIVFNYEIAKGIKPVNM
jgi:hypothetical protein